MTRNMVPILETSAKRALRKSSHNPLKEIFLPKYSIIYSLTPLHFCPLSFLLDNPLCPIQLGLKLHLGYYVRPNHPRIAFLIKDSIIIYIKPESQICVSLLGFIILHRYGHCPLGAHNYHQFPSSGYARIFKVPLQ